MKRILVDRSLELVQDLAKVKSYISHYGTRTCPLCRSSVGHCNRGINPKCLRYRAGVLLKELKDKK